jgi:hypothetical protein
VIMDRGCTEVLRVLMAVSLFSLLFIVFRDPNPFSLLNSWLSELAVSTSISLGDVASVAAFSYAYFQWKSEKRFRILERSVRDSTNTLHLLYEMKSIVENIISFNNHLISADQRNDDAEFLNSLVDMGKNIERKQGMFRAAFSQLPHSAYVIENSQEAYRRYHSLLNDFYKISNNSQLNLAQSKFELTNLTMCLEEFSEYLDSNCFPAAYENNRNANEQLTQLLNESVV